MSVNAAVGRGLVRGLDRYAAEVYSVIFLPGAGLLLIYEGGASAALHESVNH